jgi:hypothetical protein
MGPLSFVEHSEDALVLISKGIDPSTTLENSSHGEEYELTVTQQQPMTNNLELKIDKYGFIVNMDSRGNVIDATDCGFEEKIPSFQEAKRTQRREQKWKATLGSWERRRPKQMIRRLRKGLPDSVRGRVWLVLGGGIRQPGLYEEILQKTSDAMIKDYKEIVRDMEEQASTSMTSSDSASPTAQKNKQEAKPKKSEESLEYANTRAFRSIQDTIERDIHRTYPRHALFYQEEDRDSREMQDPAWLGGMCDPELAALIINLESDLRLATCGVIKEKVSNSKPEGAGTPGGQAALRRVLRAYSYYDRDVAYCQGMNFIAGMFLTLMTEEEAFWLLVGEFHSVSFCVARIVCLYFLTDPLPFLSM